MWRSRLLNFPDERVAPAVQGLANHLGSFTKDLAERMIVWNGATVEIPI